MMVQRSAGLEVDLDQVAALLCQELQDVADRDALMSKVQASCLYERDLCNIAMVAMSTLSVQVRQQRHELMDVSAKLRTTQVCSLSNLL